MELPHFIFPNEAIIFNLSLVPLQKKIIERKNCEKKKQQHFVVRKELFISASMP
jgi:hypothetical protein